MKKYILAIVAVTIVSGIGLFTACDKTEDLHKQAKTTTKEMAVAVISQKYKIDTRTT